MGCKLLSFHQPLNLGAERVVSEKLGGATYNRKPQTAVAYTHKGFIFSYQRSLVVGSSTSMVIKIQSPGTSLVVQWLRIHLPMQGTRVRALVLEDPTCCGAAKHVRHNN